MANLVISTPIPFDAANLPFTQTDSFTGAGNFLNYSDVGPKEANGKLWIVMTSTIPFGGGNANVLRCYNSSDSGLTWTEVDSAHHIQLATNSAVRLDVVFGSDFIFYISVARPSGGNITVQRFNTNTGLWMAQIVGPATTTADGLVNNLSIYQNNTNTDLVLLYDRTLVLNNTTFWIRVVGGVFGAEQTLRASAANNFAGLAVIDSSNIVRVFFDDAGTSTYQAINTDDSLQSPHVTGWSIGAGATFYRGKPVIWKSVIMMPAQGKVAGAVQPFSLMASPASSPTVFTSQQIFSEPNDSTASINSNDNGMRLMIDGVGSLWAAWMYLTAFPGSIGVDPITTSNIEMAQLCSPTSQWGNHQIFWNQLTDPQTDQPLNGSAAIVFENFSIDYIASLDVFGGLANIAGFNNTYGYYLNSATLVSAISVCGSIQTGPGKIRLQIYDDGAGEYLFSAPFNNLVVAGSENNATGLSGGAIGPFILPSPLAVVKPGLLTITISNVNAPLNQGLDVSNSVTPYVALVFAIPKKCRGQVPTVNIAKGRKGVIS